MNITESIKKIFKNEQDSFETTPEEYFTIDYTEKAKQEGVFCNMTKQITLYSYGEEQVMDYSESMVEVLIQERKIPFWDYTEVQPTLPVDIEDYPGVIE